jgi:ABC-type glutathione transport system ATPase component
MSAGPRPGHAEPVGREEDAVTVETRSDEAAFAATGPQSGGGGEPLIALSGVEKTYRMGKVDYRALRGVDLEIADGEMVAVVGPSGSGKTTILNLVTGIDRPTAGTVTVAGKRLDEMSEEELAVWRGATVGIVFQFFQLLPTLSALENAALPLDFARWRSRRERFERAARNLELVGLGDKLEPSSPGASSSASPSPARSRPTRGSSSATSPRGTWTRPPPPRCSPSSHA